jgi:tRNA1(Val) A37 N6-methylase TrmN6
VNGTLNTTCDAFLDGRVLVKQPEKGFRSGLDAVFMAAACPAKDGERVLEAGCGVGVASLCLLARVPGTEVTGIEVDSDLAELARGNALLNGLSNRFTIHTADLTAPWAKLEALGIGREAYDHVMANPPFYVRAKARLSSDRRNARSRAMDHDELDLWMRFLAAAAKPGGTCTIIHTVQALPELLDTLKHRFGGLRITPLYPKAGAGAIRVVIRGKKGSRAGISLETGVILHEADGAQTPAAEAILRRGDRLA